jgi:hypothetical protein
MRHVQKPFICKATTVGVLTLSLGLSVLGVEGWANIGSYNMQGSERYISQAFEETEPTITILRPASLSSSKKSLRTEPPLGLSEKKRLGVLLIFLSAVAEETV